MNFSTLLPRVATAIAVLALLGAAIYYGFTWMIVFAFICASLALWEFYSLFWPGMSHLADKLTGIGMTVILFAGAWFQYAAGHWGMAVDSLVVAVALCFLVAAFVFLIRYGCGGEGEKSDRESGRTPGRLGDMALTTFGVLYVPLSVSLALLLTRRELLLLLLVVAATDTFAYFAGNFWGKHRIWPKVSPKKSVEGCLGGMAGSLLACVGFGLYQNVEIGFSIVLGVVLAVVAMLGDFFESALKRAYDVKDSGAILPGHGGVLDRLDSFLFVVPAYLLLNLLVRLK